MRKLLHTAAALALGMVIFAGLLYVLVLVNVLDRLVTAEVYHAAIRESDAYNRIYDEVLPDEALRDWMAVLLGSIEGESDAYNRIYDEVLPDGALRDWMAVLLGGIEIVSQDEESDLLREVLPPEYLRKQMESNIDRFISYMHGETNKLKIYIELREPLELFEPAAQAGVQRWIDRVEIAEPIAPAVPAGLTGAVCPEEDLRRLADDVAAGPVAQLSEGRLPVSVPSLKLLTRECREQGFDRWFDRVVSDPVIDRRTSRILRRSREELRQPFVDGDTRAFLMAAAPPLVEPLMADAVADVMRELQPDGQLDVVEYATATWDLTPEDIEGRAETLRELVNTARGPGKYIALLAAALGSLLLAAIHLPRPSAMLRWLGIALFLTGSACIGAGFALHLIIPAQLRRVLSDLWPDTVDIPTPALNLAGDLLESLGRNATMGFVPSAAAVTLAGAALVAASVFLDLRRKPSGGNPPG